MPDYRSVLLNALELFASNSPNDGYNWDELYNGLYFDELTDAELYNLLNHYLYYMKGE